VRREQDREKIENLKTRFEELKAERARREADWKEVQRHVAPSVYDWDNPREKIPKRPVRYTSRPTHYLKTLVSGVAGYSISPNIAWQKLSLEDPAQTDLYGVKDWLELTERLLYAEFRRSNLYLQVTKLIEAAATYGHGVMLVDEQIGDHRLRFTTHKVSEIFLDINEYDEADTVFRYYSMTLKNVAAFFGEENLPEPRREDLKDRRSWNSGFSVIHAVYRREDFDEDSPGAKNMPYASVYLDEAQDHVLKESGYTSFPYAVFIWDPVIGTPYGESPAIHALDDIRLLNLIDKSRIQIAQLSADPPMNVPEDMRGYENVVPRGYNYYIEPNKIMSPILTGTNYPITLEINQEIENRVKDWMHVDFFLMLQREGGPNKTATEVMELQGEKAAVLSDLVVALSGPLTRIIQRSFTILWRQRKIPPPPASLVGTGARLKVDFIGPLSQAQKKYHESAGIAQGIQLIMAVAQIAPEARDVVDFDRVIKTGLEGAGVSQLLIREDEDIERIRRARQEMEAEARAQAIALEQQKNLLSNYNKLNEPVKPGSALEEAGRRPGGAAG
jgi:hypothetical protein